MIGRRTRLALALSVALVLAARPAAAESPDPEQLFAEATALAEEGDFDHALEKFEQAQKLDPGVGTLFNIAVCQQNLGRFGSAYRTFREVVAVARASGKKAREEAASARLEEVRAVAPAFSIHLADARDVIVRVDGEVVSADDFAFYPVDPGDHTVEAAAPAKRPWTKTFPAPSGGVVVPIAIPPLEVAKQTITITRETTNGRRTLGFVFGGVGLAGLAAAGVTGVLALEDRATAEERCPQRQCNGDPEGVDAVNRGKALLPINLVAWGVAAVGLGAGAFFLLTSGKKTTPARTAVVPRAGPTSAGAIFVHAF